MFCLEIDCVYSGAERRWARPERVRLVLDCLLCIHTPELDRPPSGSRYKGPNWEAWKGQALRCDFALKLINFSLNLKVINFLFQMMIWGDQVDLYRCERPARRAVTANYNKYTCHFLMKSHFPGVFSTFSIESSEKKMAFYFVI